MTLPILGVSWSGSICCRLLYLIVRESAWADVRKVLYEIYLKSIAIMANLPHGQWMVILTVGIFMPTSNYVSFCTRPTTISG